MTWEEVKNCINEWLWDNDERTYFWILNADEETKILQVKGLSGLKTNIIYAPKKFFRNIIRKGTV